MNQKKTTEFSKKMTDILNHGALNLAIAMGYKHHIFDHLKALGRPATIQTIASTAQLHPRYLKEWLGIMATGKIIEWSRLENGDAAYFLPPEHAAFLTRDAAESNMGVYAQEIPLLTSCAMESVQNGFKTGAGIPFSVYPDFQAFMAELSDAKHKETLIGGFLPSVDGGRLLGRLKRGIRVCDLGCGHGVALNLMAQAFPESHFTGMDNHAQAIQKAKSTAHEMGLANASFMIMDAAAINGKEEFFKRFDYICAFDAIHDQSHPLEALRGIRHMLAPGGLFSMIDILASSDHGDNLDHPLGPFLYTVSLMHCMPSGLSDNGAGLGMMWGRETALAMLADAGFDSVEAAEMAHDPFNLHFLCKVS